MAFRTFYFLLTFIFLSSCVRHVYHEVEVEKLSRENFMIDYAIKKNEIAQQFNNMIFDDNNEIKIALMLPLTGKNQEIGQNILNASLLALFDNRDPRIVLKIFDTESNEIKAIKAAEEIIEEGYQIIVGPVFSKNVKAITPIIKDQNIFVFTFSNDIAVAGNNKFLLGIDLRQQIQKLIKFTSENQYEYYLSLLPANDFGSYAIQELRRSVNINEGTVLKSEFYTKGVKLSTNIKRLVNIMNESPTDHKGRPLFLKEDDYNNHLNNKLLKQLNLTNNNNFEEDLNDDNLKSEEIEESEEEDIYEPKHFNEYKLILFIPDGGKVLKDSLELLNQLNFPKERVKIVGISNWYQSNLFHSDSLQDSWFIDIPHDNLKIYEDHYSNVYSKTPSRISAFAYDAISIITSLIAYENNTDNLGKLSITQDIGFNGINGVFRFRADGISERLLSIYSVKENGIEQLETEISFLKDEDLIDEINFETNITNNF